jgi:hypothetical protein
MQARLVELNDREAHMIRAITLLRETADECESRAKQISDRAVRAELIDICAEWHSLARKAASLYDRAKQLEEGSPQLESQPTEWSLQYGERSWGIARDDTPTAPA